MIANAVCNPFGESLPIIAVVVNSDDLVARVYGFGKDVWRIPFNDTATVLKVGAEHPNQGLDGLFTSFKQIFYIGGIIYAVAVAVTKMAFLCFYTRLFPSSPLQKVAYPLLAITFVQGTIFTFLFVFQCTPISYAWMSWDGEAQGKCLNFDIGAVLHAIINITLDFVIFLLPVRQLWKLNLSQKKKVQVLLMFAVGFL